MFRTIARHTRRATRQALLKFGYSPFYQYGILPGESLASCWNDIAKVVDFRPKDSVLDMGCADGLVTLEVAKRVAKVLGVDIHERRIAAASKMATRRGQANAFFAVGSLLDYPLDTFDIVLLLGVLGPKKQGLNGLERMLSITRRQIVVRTGIGGMKDVKGLGLNSIISTMDNNGFDAVCLGRHELRRNLIVGNRRGTDARLLKVTPFLFVPSQQMLSHPCLRGAEIGSNQDFGL